MLVNSSERDWFAISNHSAVVEIIYQTKIYRSIHDKKKCPWANPNCSRSGRFRLRESRSHVHLHGTAWIRISCGVAQLARQSSEFVPEIERTGTVCTQASQKSCIKRPIACQLPASSSNKPLLDTRHATCRILVKERQFGPT